MCRVTGAETGATGVKSRGHRGENHTGAAETGAVTGAMCRVTGAESRGHRGKNRTGAAEMPGFFAEKLGHRGEKAGVWAVYRGKKAPKAGFPLAVRADFAGIWGGA